MKYQTIIYTVCVYECGKRTNVRVWSRVTSFRLYAIRFESEAVNSFIDFREFFFIFLLFFLMHNLRRCVHGLLDFSRRFIAVISVTVRYQGDRA